MQQSKVKSVGLGIILLLGASLGHAQPAASIDQLQWMTGNWAGM